MFGYYKRKGAFFILTLALSILLSFFLMHLTPGDPADLILGPDAPPAQKEAFRETLNLNLPLFTQFKHYISGLARGDLGNSISYDEPVLSLILNRFPKTTFLALVSILLTLILGLGSGILATWLARFPTLNMAFLGISILGQSTPNFLLGPILILLFCILLPILPVSGTGSLSHVFLPAATLSLSLFAILSRMTYVGLITEQKKMYIQVAFAKGNSPFQVLVRHAIQNVLIPLINLVGLQLAVVLTGAVVTETIFDWPGIGSLFFSAIEKRDYPLIQGLILCFTATFAIINFLVDMMNGWVDPRLNAAADHEQT